MSPEKRENQVLEALVRSREAVKGVPIEVIERDAPGDPGCDAILREGTQKVAVEIEIVETFPRQLADDYAFRKYIVPLQQSISAAFPGSQIQVAIPVGALPKGTGWGSLALALGRVVHNALQSMGPRQMRQVAVTGMPGQATVIRYPSHSPGCYLVRFDPGAQLTSTVPAALSHAERQLAAYKREGKRTLALLDSDDTALVSPLDIVLAAADAQTGRSTIDEVFVARTMPGATFVYPARLDHRIPPDLPELILYMQLHSP